MLSLRTANGVSVPASVKQLSREAGQSAPYSVRGMLRSRGSRRRVVRVALLRYAWQTPRPGSPVIARWTDQQVREIFAAENTWSVEQYWWRASMGLVDLVFDFYPWRTLPGMQATLDVGRGAVNDLIRAQAASDGVPLDKYDQICTLLDPPPGDRGATHSPGDVVVDEAPFAHEFFQHEFGHLMGYEHAFGLRATDQTWQAYIDNFDVMADSLNNTRNIPAAQDLAGLPLPPGLLFWRSGRRLSAASLYRYESAFASSPSVVRVPTKASQSVRLVALSKGRFGDPVVAVVSTAKGDVTIEYRIAEGDDSAMSQAPALVVHSIGRRPLPPKAHEINPVVFEAQAAARIGTTIAISERDVQANVTAGGGGANSVTLNITA